MDLCCPEGKIMPLLSLHGKRSWQTAPSLTKLLSGSFKTPSWLGLGLGLLSPVLAKHPAEPVFRETPTLDMQPTSFPHQRCAPNQVPLSHFPSTPSPRPLAVHPHDVSLLYLELSSISLSCCISLSPTAIVLNEVFLAVMTRIRMIFL